MKMARIVCLTRMVRLPDLELELSKGDNALLTEEQALGSQDLAMMRRVNAVSITWEKHADVREEVPTFSKGRIKTSPLSPKLKTSPVVVTPVEKAAEPLSDHEVDLQKLADKLSERFEAQVDRIVEAVRESNGKTVVVQGTGAVASDGSVVGEYLPQDTPAFIPDKIIDQEAKADIQTKKSTSSSSTVTDAAAALRAARKGKKT